MARETYEPKIIGFLCNWCSYAGADLAGTTRLKYPPNLKIIRVPCSGRVSPELVIEPERFLVKWVSSSEGELFAQTVQEFTEALQHLPPLQEAAGRGLEKAASLNRG